SHSTATIRLPKSVTGHRTPKSARCRCHQMQAGQSATAPQEPRFRIYRQPASRYPSDMKSRLLAGLSLALASLRALSAEQTNSVANANTKVDGPIQDKIITYVIEHSGALIGAVVIVVVGFVAARFIGSLVARWLEKKPMEPPVRMLLVRISRLL